MLLLCLFSILFSPVISDSPEYTQPEQVHLSYTGDPRSLFVTWVTFNATRDSKVEYGIGDLKLETGGTMDSFQDEGPEHRRYFVHRVTLTDLRPATTYIYHVGGNQGWSAIYYFTTLRQGADWSPRFAVFGDMGNKNARSLARLQQAVQRGELDMILHVGDFAYNLDTDNGRYGDQFMRQIEPVAAYVPYMTVVGNHEEANNFSHYVHRFTMPQNNPLFYSFDLGPAHFISFSTEFYFFLKYGRSQIRNQFLWLARDLKKANKNRKRVPWIITMGHRPMYCSNYGSFDCNKYESIVRDGLPPSHKYALEPLFDKFGVDLEIWAHLHSYERMWPLYNRTVYNGTQNPYHNPPAPVHLVTGSAGCQEDLHPFTPHKPPWSAKRISDYGFSRLVVHNATHIYWEQISDKTGAVVDRIWLTKDKHGPYSAEERQRHRGVYVPLDLPPPKEAAHCPNCHQF